MDLKDTNTGSNKNNVDSEKGTLERIESEIKNTIFGVMFVLLKDEETSIYTTFFISILQFLQISYFPFHSELRDIWNSSSIADGIDTVLGYLRFVYYFKSTNYNLYVVIFYVLFAFVLFVLIDIMYVSYAYSKKKYAFSWPVVVLRAVIWLFTTVLYLPMTDYFFSIMRCVTDNKGDYVHAIFTEQMCWSGINILHSVIAILGAIIFNIIALIGVLTFFECRSNSNNPDSKVTARSNFLFLVYELILVICFNWMNGQQYQIILLAILIVGSTIVFIKFHFNSPYYNEYVAKLWTVLMAVNLWSAVMIIFARIMENTLFEGSIIAYFIGIPFIVLVVLTNRDHRVDLLLINVNKFQNGQEIQSQIRYILKLLEWQATSRNAAILLDGYIEIHKQTCNQEDCPLKQKTVKNTRIAKNLLNNDEGVNEKYAVVINLIYKMYFSGIKKFPNNTSLRIAYAFFLLDKMQSKQQALQELSQAEGNKPAIDEQFIIYRYKKIIEDEIAESQNEGTGGLDVVSEMAFQNHLKACQANIEKSALLHMEFWSQLSEDNPDLAKLNESGSKINASVLRVEEHWNKLLKINHNNTRAMRLYGKFLIEIINDKDAGEQWLEKARNIMNVNSNKKTVNVSSVGDDMNSDANPAIYVSGEQDKFGLITGINLAAASVFGYNKTELINRKVNVLMPQVYGKYHDQFIEAFLATNDGVLIGKNRERLVFGKNKSNYIFPVHLSLRYAQSIIQGPQFIATFRVEKNFKNAAYILTTPDGAIDAISSSCINLLKIDLKMVLQKRSNIQDFIPNIVKERNSIFTSTAANTKSFASINFTFPRDSEYLNENDESSASLNCYLYELSFLGGRENGGFQFRFEKPMEKSTYQAGQLEKKAQISNFQFRYERNKPVIIGEYAEGTSDMNSGHNYEPSEYNDMLNSENRSNIDGDNADSPHKSHPFAGAKNNQNDDIKEKIDYGIGIKTMRLLNGRVVDIEEDKSHDSDEEGAEKGPEDPNKPKEQQGGRNNEEPGDEDAFRDFNSTFKSRKALNNVINDRRPPAAIRNLKWTANILMASLLTLAIVEYAVGNDQFRGIVTSFNYIDQSSQLISELMKVLSKTRDLYLYNVQIYDRNLYNYSSLVKDIEGSLQNAQNIKIALDSSSGLSSAHSNLMNSPVIALYDSISSFQYKGLSQAIDQIISKAFAVSNKDINNITTTDSDYFFVTYNLLNDMYLGLRSSSDYYVLELSDQISSKKSIFLALLLISAIALILAMIVLFPVLLNVNKTREEVLSLFLDIPEKTVKSLYTKCESFISNLQVGEEDDVVSELDEEEFKQNEDDNLQEYTPKRKKRKFKNSGKSQRKFYLQFLLGAGVIEAYFIYNYFNSVGILNDVDSIIPEINDTSIAEAFYSFSNNAERQLFINNTFPIMKQTNPQTIVTSNVNAMYSLDSEIHQDHSVNINIHSQTYIDAFNNIMMLSPCTYFTSVVPLANCTAFADSAVNQGMAVGLTRHFENLRFLLTLYVRYSNGGAWDQDNVNTTFPNLSPAPSAIQTNILNLMRLSQAQEIDTMQHIYINQSFRYLMNNFQAGMNSYIDSNITRRLIIFIFFLVALFAIHVIFWIPLISKLSNDIWRTKSMLTMIPLNVISKIKNVKVYLRKFWNDRSIDY